MQNLEIFESIYSTWTKPNGDTELSLLSEDCDADCTDYESGEGWFFWFCSPGCLPEGDPMGPYDSEEQARGDAEVLFGDHY